MKNMQKKLKCFNDSKQTLIAGFNEISQFFTVAKQLVSKF